MFSCAAVFDLEEILCSLGLLFSFQAVTVIGDRLLTV